MILNIVNVVIIQVVVSTIHYVGKCTNLNKRFSKHKIDNS